MQETFPFEKEVKIEGKFFSNQNDYNTTELTILQLGEKGFVFDTETSPGVTVSHLHLVIFLLLQKKSKNQVHKESLAESGIEKKRLVSVKVRYVLKKTKVSDRQIG